ncbi:lysophospholipid acyltransferase family protein [Thermostilla marina]
MWRTAIDYAVYLVVRTAICAAQMIPIEMAAVVCDAVAFVFNDVLHVRRRVVEENLRHAFPALSDAARHKLARRMWRHLFLLAFEAAHAPRKIHKENWQRHIRLTNVESLVNAFLDDRPLILVTGHFGNFEMGGYLLGVFGLYTSAVARTLDNPFLHRFVERFRGATGQKLIPKVGGYDQILEVLASKQTLSVLADQSAGPKGCWVDFFGRPASTYKAIALFAMQYDAPIIVAGARRLDGPMRFELFCEDVLDPRTVTDPIAAVRDITQWYTKRLEDMIRRDPDQYWWVHRRWKDTRRKKAKKADTLPKAA